MFVLSVPLAFLPVRMILDLPLWFRVALNVAGAIGLALMILLVLYIKYTGRPLRDPALGTEADHEAKRHLSPHASGLLVATASSIGGGLAGMISPSKLFNAATSIARMDAATAAPRPAFVVGLIIASVRAVMIQIWAY